MTADMTSFVVAWTGEDGQDRQLNFISKHEAERLCRELKAKTFGPVMSELVIAANGNRTFKRIVSA